MNSQPQKLSEMLRAWRKTNGWNQAFAAGKIGVKVGTYRNWERDKCEPQGLARDAVLKIIKPA